MKDKVAVSLRIVRRFRLLGLVLWALLRCVSCSKPKKLDYCPLIQGARWTYAVRIISPKSVEKNGTMVSEIGGEEVLGKLRYTRFTNTPQGLPLGSAQVGFCRRDERGVFYRQSLNEGDSEVLLWPDPLTVGRHWETTVGGVTRSFKVEGLESSSMTGKKYENCVRISFEQNSPSGRTTGTDLRAPGIGSIRQETDSNGTKMEWTLRDYAIPNR